MEVAFGNNSWEKVIFEDNSFLALENNGYLGKSTDGINWKSTGIIESGDVRLSFLNGFCRIK